MLVPVCGEREQARQSCERWQMMDIYIEIYVLMKPFSPHAQTVLQATSYEHNNKGTY